MEDRYINTSKAFSSSLVKKVGASTTFNSFVPIKEIAKIKGLSSTRSLRLEINKTESQPKTRHVLSLILKSPSLKVDSRYELFNPFETLLH